MKRNQTKPVTDDTDTPNIDDTPHVHPISTPTHLFTGGSTPARDHHVVASDVERNPDIETLGELLTDDNSDHSGTRPTRLHHSYDDSLKVAREQYQNCSVMISA